ncbi:pyridoxal 5'-phosphate synthase glutaminase subunit PdxT [uncultured Sneathia sp.]|uniref:pyridoxal 5'-phosphate synthase glutaminase subunit PdxT n=1 Tax=uncultured Sneathia sp. TaxID=278067 RepID=UPI002598B114|nr:pyridoxal 5'-phosphate synthase glutaminase subunit PdxT [uncultured Sneathia sp.]
MVIAVLSLQGAFIEHENMLKKIGVDCFEIRNKQDLSRHFDGLILPGGESTTMGKLLHDLDLFDTLKKRIEDGLCVFGTCAGMILLARKINNDTRVHFGLMDIEVKRNAYGRQLGSFKTVEEFKGIGKVPMVFIRGPYVERVSDNVEILSTVNNNIVAVKQNNMLVTAYHPELTDDTRVHEYFISMIKKQKNGDEKLK